MKIKVIVNNVGEINKHKILKIGSDEMKSPTFEILVKNFNFKNGFTIKNKLFKNKLAYVFERKRDRLTPHGKVRWFGKSNNSIY